MKIGMVGLGKMGGNMTRRLIRAGHEVVAFDLDEAAVAEAVGAGADGAENLEDLVGRLEPPRHIWIMVPAGPATEATLTALGDLLDEGDAVIDGGNSRYTDTLRWGERLAESGVALLDAGTSGGVWGLEGGYSLMIGGPDHAVARLGPVFEALAPGPEKGWGHVGPTGSGHFVKMVHNGIEYGLMEAYAEGFQILKAKAEFDLDLHQIAEIWRHGSVVRSWLLDLTARALNEDQELADVSPWVDDSGEGRWTVEESIDLAVPAPVIALALMMRFRSRDQEAYAARLLAAMRHQFGGHAVRKAAEDG